MTRHLPHGMHNNIKSIGVEYIGICYPYSAQNIAESVRLTQLRVTLNTADIQCYENGRCNK